MQSNLSKKQIGMKKNVLYVIKLTEFWFSGRGIFDPFSPTNSLILTRSLPCHFTSESPFRRKFI